MIFFLLIILIPFFSFSQEITNLPPAYIIASPIIIVHHDPGARGGGISNGHTEDSFKHFIGAIDGQNITSDEIRQHIRTQEEQSLNHGEQYAKAVQEAITKRNQYKRKLLAHSIAHTHAHSAIVVYKPQLKTREFVEWNTPVAHIQTEEQYTNIKASSIEEISQGNYNNVAENIERLYYSNNYDSDISFISAKGIFLPEKIEKTLPASPLSSVPFSTKARSDYGNVLNRVANKYQVAWAAKQSDLNASANTSMSYYLGLSLLRKADSLYGENPSAANSYLKAANNIIEALSEFGSGFSTGLGRSTDRALDSLSQILPFSITATSEYYRMKHDPKYAFEKILLAADTIPELAANMWQAMSDQYDKLKNGSWREKGEVFGEISLDVLVGYATNKGGALLSIGGNAAYKASMQVAGRQLATESSYIFKSIYSSRLDEIHNVVTNLRNTSPARLQDGLEVYNVLSKSGLTTLSSEALAITSNLVTTKSKYYDDMVRVASSANAGNYRAKYFNSAADLPKIEQALKTADEITNMPLTTKEGYIVRLGSKEYNRSGADLAKPHDNSLQAAGRYALGGDKGQEVLSYGFGSSKLEAYKAAKRELQSYVADYDINSYRLYVEKFEAREVLDLSRLNNKMLDQITDSRLGAHSYMLTNAIGLMAGKKNIKYIHAPSAVENAHAILHEVHKR